MKKWERICYRPCMPLGEDGKCVTASKEHIEMSRRAAAEGMVLLKNNANTLPLEKGARVAVFGKGQYDYVKTGGGSGEVHTAYSRNLYDGLKIKADEGKIYLYDGLIKYYKEKTELEYIDGKRPGCTEEPPLTDEQVKNARCMCDTAIISICRFSSEGWDRKGEPDDGDFYLSKAEQAMIEKVCDYFDKIIVVYNTGAQTDSEWYVNNDKIGAVLYTWHGGIEGGLATADILVGDVNPSGKLVDTFAKRFSDYPSSESFSESDDYVKYYEDIYVGYRYFETINGANEKVNYPFGYGLSYTKFDINNINVYQDNDMIKISADVKNIGTMSGKEVVQVYYSAPQGLLGKPARELGAFVKTDELKPGESRTYFAEFKISDMASYDDLGKICESAYVLEKGNYCFYIGNSVRDTVKADFEYVAESDIVTEKLTRRCPPSELEKRLLSNGTYEDMPSFEKNTNIPPVPNSTATPPEQVALLIDVVDQKVTMDEFIAQLSDEELVSLTYGNSKMIMWRYHTNSGPGGTFGMGDSKKYGIPEAMTADGPAGVRMANVSVCTTALPCATSIACTWNTDIAYNLGVLGAREAKENNLAIWLTPALNIHRNPLCGRNFEYFSEDPYVAGKMAAATVRGIQSQHIAATPKHFLANNKETNRQESDSIMSERAMREIYLKGFEICVKESDPWTIMSAYNKINGTRTSENYDTLTGILRNEWGYKGLVMSDWWNTAELSKEIVAGNDVRMPIGNDAKDSVLEKIQSGEISRGQIEVCVKRLLEMIIKLD